MTTLVHDALPTPTRQEPPAIHSAPDAPTPRRSRGERIESAGVFASTFAAYFTVAMLLDFRYYSFNGDAISRMANGFYILHSRDPHLAAIGFVWNPLSSIAVLPFMAFNSLFPVLASHNVAGTTVSALAMAGAAYQLHALLREWRVARVPRLVLTAFFAFNPMILYFGGNGMSEALYLFLTIAAARYLCRWLRDGDLQSLVYCAIALGVGYLERTEPMASAALAVPLVFGVTFVRTAGDRSRRMWTALTDVTILVLPVVTSVIGWAAMSYVITGQAFQQLTSKYGNATLLANSHQAATTMHLRLVHELKAITYMAPLLALIVVAALATAVIRRNSAVAGFLVILAGGLGFTLASYLVNAIFPWYRYYILVAPIEVLLVGSMFAVPARLRPADPSSLPAGRARSPGRWERALAAILAALVAVVLLGASIPGTAMAMNNLDMAPDVVQYTGFIFHKHPTGATLGAEHEYAQVLSMTRYLEAQHLSNGDVVVDNANSCIPNVDTNINNPRIFVIHNDRDFQRVLADPLVFHAHYLLVGLAINNDAVLAQFPNIGKGTPWAKLVHTFKYSDGGFCSGYRLFRVVGHPTANF